MACILQPKCSFFAQILQMLFTSRNSGVEVKITSMHDIHMFRRDRTCRIIKCNPWSTRLHPHPTLIKKMKTYLELEGMLGPKSKVQPQQNQSRPAQSNTNPLERREANPTNKKRKLIPTERYKVQVVAKPKSTSRVSNTATQSSAIVSNTTMNS